MGKAWSHERGLGNDEWLTPLEVVDSLGRFDLDPCSPVERPWNTAAFHYTKLDDGLGRYWSGRVWMNPPYGRETGKWLEKLAGHGDGIALIFARTDTRMFQRWVFGAADSVLFLAGRLTFFDAKGVKGPSAAGAASCLVAYGVNNTLALLGCGLPGKLVVLK